MMMTDASLAPKERSTAAVLAILLGTFGFHRFYLNQPELGVIYALLCWTGIPTVVGWIEGVRWLLMSDETFARCVVARTGGGMALLPPRRLNSR